VVSANGRFVVFTSLATNLVAGDSNGFQDVFRHDRQSGQTELISQSSAGAGANGNSFTSAISADGSVIAFASAASNLVSGDNNARTDIFVRDVNLGTTTVVSITSSGQLGNGTSSGPSISADGQFVTFLANSNNLVSGDSNNREDVFRHDRLSGETLRMSVDPAGRQADTTPPATVTAGQISPDGSRVAFETTAADFELTVGVAGARSVMLATAAEPPREEEIFADGFE
jgi:Tol biopolymer transport system component